MLVASTIIVSVKSLLMEIMTSPDTRTPNSFDLSILYRFAVKFWMSLKFHPSSFVPQNLIEFVEIALNPKSVITLPSKSGPFHARWNGGKREKKNDIWFPRLTRKWHKYQLGMLQCFIFLFLFFQDTFIGTGRAQKRVAKEILHNEPECGITRHRQFAKRIIGGHKAKFAELPWQVRIF